MEYCLSTISPSFSNASGRTSLKKRLIRWLAWSALMARMSCYRILRKSVRGKSFLSQRSSIPMRILRLSKQFSRIWMNQGSSISTLNSSSRPNSWTQCLSPNSRARNQRISNKSRCILKRQSKSKPVYWEIAVMVRYYRRDQCTSRFLCWISRE